MKVTIGELRQYAGQLSSDLDDLQKIASGTAPPVSYALVWLASVLRFVGTKIVA